MSNLLIAMAGITTGSACSSWFWGEEELPECLKEECRVADEQLQDGEV